MGGQSLAGELAIIVIHRMARIGLGNAERRRIFLKAWAKAWRRHVVLAGQIGDQATVIALIELGPIGVAQAVERGESLIGLAVGLLHPGAGERRGEIGDRPLARRREILFGVLVAALLERLAAEQEAGDPVGRLDLDQFLGKLDGAIPMGGGGLEQEGLLENDLVAGILGQSLGIEIGGGNGVVVAAGHAPGQIVAEQRAGIVWTPPK